MIIDDESKYTTSLPSHKVDFEHGIGAIKAVKGDSVWAKVSVVKSVDRLSPRSNMWGSA